VVVVAPGKQQGGWIPVGEKKATKATPKSPTSKKTLKGSKKIGDSRLMIRFQ